MQEAGRLNGPLLAPAVIHSERVCNDPTVQKSRFSLVGFVDFVAVLDCVILDLVFQETALFCATGSLNGPLLAPLVIHSEGVCNDPMVQKSWMGHVD